MTPSGSRRKPTAKGYTVTGEAPVCDFTVSIYTSISGGTTAIMSWSEGTYRSPRAVEIELIRASWPGKMTRQEHGLWCLQQLLRQYYQGSRPARPRDSASPGINDIPGGPPDVSGIALG